VLYIIVWTKACSLGVYLNQTNDDLTLRYLSGVGRNRYSKVRKGVSKVENISSGRTSNTISLLAGVWMVLAPFLLGFTNFPLAAWNSVLIGVIVGCLAIYRMTSPTPHVWTGTVSFLLGLWAIVSPFALGAGESGAAVWSGVIMGAIVAVFGVASMATSDALVRNRHERQYER